MKICLLCVVAFGSVACGGKTGRSAEDPGDGVDSDGPTRAREETLDLEFAPVPESSTEILVTLTSVDETGSSTRTKIGTFAGPCQRIATSTMAGELLAFRCSPAEGDHLDARLVQRQGVLNLLETTLAPSEEPDPMAYEQRDAFPLPSGAKIEVAPMREAAPPAE